MCGGGQQLKSLHIPCQCTAVVRVSCPAGQARLPLPSLGSGRAARAGRAWEAAELTLAAWLPSQIHLPRSRPFQLPRPEQIRAKLSCPGKG